MGIVWARVDSGVVREVTHDDPAGLYHPSLVWVADSSGQVTEGDLYDGASFSAPVHDSAALLRVQAQAALDASDVTVIRCVEHAVAVPRELIAYRAALRTIVGGGAGPLPSRPAYPADT